MPKSPDVAKGFKSVNPRCCEGCQYIASSHLAAGDDYYFCRRPHLLIGEDKEQRIMIKYLADTELHQFVCKGWRNYKEQFTMHSEAKIETLLNHLQDIQGTLQDYYRFLEPHHFFHSKWEEIKDNMEQNRMKALLGRMS